MYFEGYVGYHQSHEMKLFFNRAKAEKYAKALNEELARENHCGVKGLGDYYEIIELDLAQF